MPRSSNKVASIRRSIQAAAPPEKVYAAFETEDALGIWYMDGTSVEFRPGGTLSFDGPEGSVRATFVEMEPHKRIVLDYSAPWWGRVTWEMEPTPKGTR